MGVAAEDGSGEGKGQEGGILIDGSDGAEDAGSGVRGRLSMAEVTELGGEAGGEDGRRVEEIAASLGADWNL